MQKGHYFEKETETCHASRTRAVAWQRWNVTCGAAVFTTQTACFTCEGVSASAREHSRQSARIMSRVELLRVLVNERLSAAAEEIFEAVKKTIAGYEEEILLSKREIHRQRRVLQTVLKPDIKTNKHSGLWINGLNSLFDRDWSRGLTVPPRGRGSG